MSNDNSSNVVAFKPKSMKPFIQRTTDACLPEVPSTGQITYQQLIERYGTKAAYAILVALEKITQTHKGGNHADAEKKFKSVLDKLAQDFTTQH